MSGWWENLVDSWSWTAAGVLLALLLGVANLLGPMFSRWRAGRRAELEVRFERYWPTSGLVLMRLVVENRGPAVATGIALRARRSRDGDYTIKADFMRLLRGQEFHCPVQGTAAADEEYLFATLTWEDGRKGRQGQSDPILLSRQDQA